MESIYQRCAELIRNAKYLIITAGAGMGVDSGLPDFRGKNGMWNMDGGILIDGKSWKFEDLANPEAILSTPELAWGFYGWRYNTYTMTTPHDGFYLMQRWIRKYRHSYFIVTSNVDGQFQRAGFSRKRILEKHGSLLYWQCLKRTGLKCQNYVWKGRRVKISDMKSSSPPRCKFCGGLARPNVSMFKDRGWVLRPYLIRQKKREEEFLETVNGSPVLVLELGAGTKMPAIRKYTESICNATVIRVNQWEPEIESFHISVRASCLEALKAMNEFL